MTNNFVYIVLGIPSNGAAQTFYGNCAYRVTGELPPSTQYLYSDVYQNLYTTGIEDSNIIWKCSDNNTPNYSVYTYMGGPSTNQPPGTQKLIPSIGGNYPSDIPNGSVPELGAYAALAYQGPNPIQNNQAVPGYIILAYDPSWFSSWADLDIIAPSKSTIFTGKNPYNILNYSTNPTGPFFIQGPNNTKGQQIANLDVPGSGVGLTFFDILSNFCFLQTNNCPSSINPGVGYCSNTLSNTGTSITNYCYELMTNNRVNTTTNVAPYPGFDTSMTEYCNSQPQDGSITECYCVNPTTFPNNAFKDLLGLGFSGPQNGGGPSIPASSGNLSCWWEPCIDTSTSLVPSTELALVPGSNPAAASSCPDICVAVTDIVASGGGTIISQNTNIQQTLYCCASGQSNCNASNPNPASGNCNENTPCPSGQQCVNNNCIVGTCENGASTCPSGSTCINGKCIPNTTCTTNTDCTSPQVCTDGKCQTVESFWDKYKIWIITAIVMIILFLILFAWLLIFG